MLDIGYLADGVGDLNPDNYYPQPVGCCYECGKPIHDCTELDYEHNPNGLCADCVAEIEHAGAVKEDERQIAITTLSGACHDIMAVHDVFSTDTKLVSLLRRAMSEIVNAQTHLATKED